MTDATIAKCKKAHKMCTGKGKITATAAMEQVDISNHSYYGWLKTNGRVKGKKRSVRRKAGPSWKAQCAALENQIDIFKGRVAELEAEATSWLNVIKMLA